jgi:hypothetical protein
MGNLTERDYLEDLDVDGRIILNGYCSKESSLPPIRYSLVDLTEANCTHCAVSNVSLYRDKLITLLQGLVLFDKKVIPYSFFLVFRWLKSVTYSLKNHQNWTDCCV